MCSPRVQLEIDLPNSIAHCVTYLHHRLYIINHKLTAKWLGWAAQHVKLLQNDCPKIDFTTECCLEASRPVILGNSGSTFLHTVVRARFSACLVQDQDFKRVPRVKPLYWFFLFDQLAGQRKQSPCFLVDYPPRSDR